MADMSQFKSAKVNGPLGGPLHLPKKVHYTYFAGASVLGGVAGSTGAVGSAGAAGCSIVVAAGAASSFFVQAKITDNPPTTIKIRSAFILDSFLYHFITPYGAVVTVP